MILLAGIACLALVHGATIQRGPVGLPDAPVNFDCSNRADGFYTDYQEDCRQFYWCNNGEVSVFHCSPQARFNAGIRACVNDDSFSCVEPSESYKVRNIASDFDCGSRDDGYYAAAEDECKTFHHCSRGISTSHQCAEGTRFDESVNACVLAELARCAGKDKARGMSDCASQSDGYYPVKGDCSSFYRCSKGIMTNHKCEDGTNFDVQVNACVMAEMAKCSTKRDVNEEESNSNIDCSKEKDGYYANVEEDCRSFESCQGGQGETIYCADGAKFDENARECLPEKDVSCKTRRKRVPSHGPPSWLQFSCEDKTDGYFGDRNRDCRQFYRCRNGEKTTYFCAAGTQFSDSHIACIHEGPDVCPAPEAEATSKREVKTEKLHNLLEQLRLLLMKKKHR